MTTAIFDIERDNELIVAGKHFWCEACLIARPISEQSPDQRYCQSCYNFLMDEATLISSTRHPGWIPKTGKKQCPISGQGDGILSPAISYSVASQGHSKKKRLPRKRIFEMANAGLSPKIIAGRLKVEYRIDVSYKVIEEMTNANPKNRQTLRPQRESKTGQLPLVL